MTRVPMMGFNPMPNPDWTDRQRAAFLNMGLTAENLASQYGISRDEQDAYAPGKPGEGGGRPDGRAPQC